MTHDSWQDTRNVPYWVNKGTFRETPSMTKTEGEKSATLASCLQFIERLQHNCHSQSRSHTWNRQKDVLNVRLDDVIRRTTTKEHKIYSLYVLFTKLYGSFFKFPPFAPGFLFLWQTLLVTITLCMILSIRVAKNFLFHLTMSKSMKNSVIKINEVLHQDFVCCVYLYYFVSLPIIPLQFGII